MAIQEYTMTLKEEQNAENVFECLPKVTLTCLVCGPAEDVGGVSIACQGWLGSGKEAGSAR